MSLLQLADGQVAVPGNRWDLAVRSDPGALESADPPSVSVVVPYFDAPRSLELVLTGLAMQNYPPTRYQVIVADDGSPTPPRLPRALPHRHGEVRLSQVWQENRGFRAAAVRNLGAQAADGELLCFLDADTIPTPDYLREVTQLPAVVPDALVAGRRRHADLTDWTADRVRSWLTGEGPAPAELPEPGWLIDAYRASNNLLLTDDRSFRYIISAVMCCSAALFDELTGFDPSFTSYGGEDWELAYRAYNAGAVLAHARSAIAWHDGPDWGARGDATERERTKTVERHALARLIPEPVTRRNDTGTGGLDDDGRDCGSGGEYRVVDIVVRWAGSPAPDLIGTVASILASGRNSRLDLALYLDPAEHATWTAASGGHPRVRIGSPPADVLARCRFQVILPGPCRFTDVALASLLERLVKGEVGRVVVPLAGTVPITAVATRAIRRGARWAQHAPAEDLVDRFFGSELLDGDLLGISTG